MTETQALLDANERIADLANRVAELEGALSSAKGHVMNAAIDLEVGQTRKASTIKTLRDCENLIDAALKGAHK